MSVYRLFSASVFSCLRFIVHYLVCLFSCFCFAFCNFLHSAINAANGGRPQPQQWQRHHGHASRPKLACCQALFPLAKWFDGGTSAPRGQLRDEAWSIQPVELVPRCLRCSLTPFPCPTVRQSVRLHNIIFHIVRSLACHFLHYATVSPLRQAGRVGSSSGLIPKSKPNPQHNLQALLNPAPNVINLRTEVCI